MIFVSRGGRIPDCLRTSGAPWLVMTLVTPLTPSYPGTMTWWNIGPVVFNSNWYHDLVIISSTGPIEDYWHWNGIVKPEFEVPKPRPKGLGLTLKSHSDNKPLALDQKASQEPTLHERTDEAVTTVKEIIETRMMLNLRLDLLLTESNPVWMRSWEKVTQVVSCSLEGE